MPLVLIIQIMIVKLDEIKRFHVCLGHRETNFHKYVDKFVQDIMLYFKKEKKKETEK